MHAARAFLDAGLVVAGHSDSPVSEADPLCVGKFDAENLRSLNRRLTPAA